MKEKEDIVLDVLENTGNFNGRDYYLQTLLINIYFIIINSFKL